VPDPRAGVTVRPVVRGARIGIDVGGTFTDVVVDGWDAGRGTQGPATTSLGTTIRGKVRSTPDDPGRAVVAACELVATEAGVDLADLLGRVERFGLGTTVVTNVLATRTGRRLGLLTTRGFEDLVPLARGNRVCEGGWLLPPPALVDRTRIVGLAERTDRDGRVLQAVDPAEVRATAERLVGGEGVEALVVSLLWSFRNPANEEAVRAALVEAHPAVPVVVGSELAPVIREYERTQFALLNAYVGGALDWLTPLEVELRSRGLAAPIVLTHSNGGATTVAGARAVPVGLAQSGPAAGAAAATHLAQARREGDVVTCDLGGTSLDVALVHGGEALRRTRGSLLGHWTSLSMVDVDSVGSGGGSIAWVDAVGAIRVGPRSAGADPGPACYGRGGEDPTLTDALVVLGHLDPERFLDGRMPLDGDRAAAACAALGAPLGLDARATAWGIREVALATMARAVRTRIASRGLVASDLTVLAYGGCGGLFAAELAADTRARRAVLPALAPVFSAHGAATAALRRERARSVAMRLPGDPDALRDALTELAKAVVDDLAGDGVAAGDVAVALEADVRFERQGAELTIPVPADADGRAVLDDLAARFTAEYVQRFGAGAVAMGVAVEVMTVRAVGVAGGGDDAAAEAPTSPAAGVAPEPSAHRTVRLGRDLDVAVPVVRWSDVAVGVVLAGPALVDAGDTTAWVAPGCRAHVDALGALVLEVAP
jgi:N-methylhydantoinase A